MKIIPILAEILQPEASVLGCPPQNLKECPHAQALGSISPNPEYTSCSILLGATL